MSEEPRYPDTEGKDLKTQVDELKDYIVNLQRYVRYALNNIDTRNMSQGTRISFRKIGDMEVRVEQTEDGLKSTVGKVNQVETDVQNIKLYQTFIRYSANADGSDMTVQPQPNTEYMGLCTIRSETAPEDPDEYDWVAFKGESGKDGEDATVLRIDSSRGTVFKNNQVSTVLSVVIYKGSKRITDSTEMRKEYGIGAYLEWSWQRMGEDAFGTILSDDSRIGQDGFTFTLSPEDVDTKVVFMCRLITD